MADGVGSIPTTNIIKLEPFCDVLEPIFIPADGEDKMKNNKDMKDDINSSVYHHTFNTEKVIFSQKNTGETPSDLNHFKSSDSMLATNMIKQEASSILEPCFGPAVGEDKSDNNLNIKHQNISINCQVTNTGNLCISAKKTGEKPFHCDICDFKSTDSYRLKIHIRTHRIGKPFHCNQCTFKCTDKTQLIRHIKTHTGEKPFQCDYCKYRSSTKSQVRDHMKRHTGEDLFPCDLCEYKSLTIGNLRKHLRRHMGVKPFNCSQCDFKSCTKNGLNIHVLRKHTEEKPFRCNLCDYAGTTNSCVKKHLFSHTGEKPFQCDLCDYKGAFKYSLKRHKKNAHISHEQLPLVVGGSDDLEALTYTATPGVINHLTNNSHIASSGAACMSWDSQPNPPEMLDNRTETPCPSPKTLGTGGPIFTANPEAPGVSNQELSHDK